MTRRRPRIAYFITSHGFGHATRACAVMIELQQLDPGVELHVVTTVPQWLFEQSLVGPFHYHAYPVDVGLVQHTPLAPDILATLDVLRKSLPFDENLVGALSRLVREIETDLVVCDIAPLGIEVARRAGLPSVLVENFTWDWIFHGLAADESAFREHADRVAAIYERVTYRARCEPVCGSYVQDVTVPPVARRGRRPRAEVRSDLRLGEEHTAVLVTMGGTELEVSTPEAAMGPDGLRFVVPSGVTRTEWRDRLILIPSHSAFYHPDLVNACDIVVGKLGYGTVAETYHAGTALAYVGPSRFPEAPVLERFVLNQQMGFAISAGEYAHGTWMERLDGRSRRAPPPPSANGARAAAQFLRDLAT